MSTARLVQCQACKDLFRSCDTESGFERWGQGEPIRLINNPAVWGADHPRYTLLGFSKGETQNKAIAQAKASKTPLSAVPFKGMRKRLAWLLSALRVRPLDKDVNGLFESEESEIQSASLIRCSISARKGDGQYSYKLGDILAADRPSGGKVKKIIERCTKTHIAGNASGQTFIMLGLDKELISWCRDSFSEIFGTVDRVSETTYRTKSTSWVHVAHPSGTQTDPQYQRWCEGKTAVAKVNWARDEVAFRQRALLAAQPSVAPDAQAASLRSAARAPVN